MFSTNTSPHNHTFSNHLADYAVYFLFIAIALLFLLIFQDYGVTWDEKVQFEYGMKALRYYTSGFRDESCNHFNDLYLYGALFELMSAAIYEYIGIAKYEIHHFLISACALLTLVSVYKLSRLIRNSLTPFFTVVILITMPHFFGQAFFNPKDIPFACSFSWAMYAVCRLLILEKARFQDFCLAGLAIGLALSVRVGGLLIFILLGAGILMKLWQRRIFIAPATICVKTVIPAKAGIRYWLGCPRLTSCRGRLIKSGMTFSNIDKSIRNASGLALLTLIAWGVMTLFWPWTHSNPFSLPFEAFRKMTAFPSVLPVLFEGRYITSSQLPWYYLPKYFLITTPPFILIFFVIGLGVFMFHQTRNARDKKSLVIFLVELWFFFPILYVVCRRPNIYDGIRHFLFILPAMAIIAAAGATGMRNILSKLVSKPWMVNVFAAAMLLQPVADMVSLHPYQSTYYNFFVGGTRGADGRYETDYWASSYKEGAEWINRRLTESRDKKITLVVIANDYSLDCAKYYLDSRVKIFKVWSTADRLPLTFDYLMATTRYLACYRFDFLPVAHVVGRQGAAFTVIRQGTGSEAHVVSKGDRM